MCKRRLQNAQETPKKEALALLKNIVQIVTLVVTVSIDSFAVRITVLNISNFSVLFPYSKQCVVLSKLIIFTVNSNIHKNIKWSTCTINVFLSHKIIITTSQYKHQLLSKFSLNSHKMIVYSTVYMYVACNRVSVWEVRRLTFHYMQLR